MLFKHIHRHLVCLTLLLSLFVPMSRAQSAQNSLIRQIESLFETKNYSGVILLTGQFEPTDTEKAHEEAIRFYRVASLFYSDSPLFIAESYAFQNLYPISSYSDQINYYAGMHAFRRKEYELALTYFEEISLKNRLSIVESQDVSYRTALCYLELDHDAHAIKLLRPLYNSRGHYYYNAAFYLGFIAFRQADYPTAVGHLETVADQTLYRAKSLYYRMQIKHILHDYNQSESIGRQLLADFPDTEFRPEVNRILGECAFQRRQYSEAIPLLNSYVEESRCDTVRSAQYALGVSLFQTGNVKNALAPLERSVGEASKQTQYAYFYLGMAYAKAKETTKARMAFEQASQLDYDPLLSELSFYNYALSVHGTKMTGFGESMGIFETFLNRYPRSQYASQVGRFLLEMYTSSNNYEQALLSINRIKHPSLELIDAKQLILYQMGVQESIEGDLRKAQEVLREAIRLKTSSPNVTSKSHLLLADLYSRQTRYKEAETQYQKAAQTAPNGSDWLPRIHYGLGYTYFNRKQYDDALSAYRKVNTTDEQMVADIQNRIGDIQFVRRQFHEADATYGAVVEKGIYEPDYSLYQQAIVRGVLKQFDSKISLLQKLRRDYPHSPYQADALNEIVATYFYQEKYDDAIRIGRQLLSEIPSSNHAPVVALQIANSYNNSNRTDQAIEAYKEVMRRYPTSDQAKVANNDLKSLFEEKGAIDEYAAFITSFDGKFALSSDEKESLTYFSAEKQYMRGEQEAARNSFIKYLQGYPKGIYIVASNYYLGELFFRSSDLSNATIYFEAVLRSGTGKYSLTAKQRLAEIAYEQKQYDKAYDLFITYAGEATDSQQILEAQLYALRSAHHLGRTKEVETLAGKLLTQGGQDAILETEIRAYRAKAYASQRQITLAQADWSKLATDTRSSFGAEAHYLLARSYFEQGNYDRAETECLAFAESGTSHTLWLANTYIVLADIYLRKGDKFTARQYLLNLKANFTENDEINRQIDARLLLCE